MKWISVKDRLPDEGVDVIVCSRGGFFYVAYFDDGEWWESNGGGAVAVAHWMPIEPPKATDHRAESKREGREL